MTARTGVMRICGTAHQGIGMAVARTAGGCGYDNARMTRITSMLVRPRTSMTRCTVSAGTKVLTDR